MSSISEQVLFSVSLMSDVPVVGHGHQCNIPPENCEGSGG